MSRLQDTLDERLPISLCELNNQGHLQQQQQQHRAFKPPYHHSVGCLDGAASTGLEDSLRRCSSLKSGSTSDGAQDCSRGNTPSPASLIAVTTPRSHQLPRTGDSSKTKHQAKELTCPLAIADAVCKDCELRQLEVDLQAPTIGKTCSPAPCKRTPSREPHSTPSQTITLPRQLPQRTAAKQGTAPDLDPSQVAAQEKEIGHVTTCENPGSQSQQCSKFESFACKEPAPAFENLFSPRTGGRNLQPCEKVRHSQSPQTSCHRRTSIAADAQAGFQAVMQPVQVVQTGAQRP